MRETRSDFNPRNFGEGAKIITGIRPIGRGRRAPDIRSPSHTSPSNQAATYAPNGLPGVGLF